MTPEQARAALTEWLDDLKNGKHGWASYSYGWGMAFQHLPPEERDEWRAKRRLVQPEWGKALHAPRPAEASQTAPPPTEEPPRD